MTVIFQEQEVYKSITRRLYSKIITGVIDVDICFFQCEGLDHRGQPTSSVQTVITLSKLVTPQAMQQCLHFIYTGTIDSRFCESQVSAGVRPKRYF